MNRRNDVVPFTKEMKSTHTILVPDMLPIHFGIIKRILEQNGYNVALLDTEGPDIAQTGLKYVHNDICYPALLVIGQFIHALKSGKYDPEKTALMLTQTGGGCRASNYVHLLRKGLTNAGFGNVPVISLSLSGLEENPGFTLSLSTLRKVVAALVYGDELMLLANQVRPYEATPGDTDAHVHYWIDRISELTAKNMGYNSSQMKVTMAEIAKDFDNIPIILQHRIKVGIVGEIYVKYCALGNNNLENFLHSQGCEYMVPGLMDFLLYCINNGVEDYNFYGGSLRGLAGSAALRKYLSSKKDAMIKAVNNHSRFVAPSSFEHTKSLVKGVVSVGSKMGEGWLLTAEMLELVEKGYPNIICTQPFGCLPNHINGRGMMNRIKRVAPEANIVAIDYDPSLARVNQENRIKLMLSSVKDNQPTKTTVEEQSGVKKLLNKPKHAKSPGYSSTGR